MITQLHLEHWIKEMRYQLQGAINEIARTDGVSKGVSLDNKQFVSFEYLQEKSKVIDALLKTILKDIFFKSGRFRNLGN